MVYRWADHKVFPAGEGAILFGVDQASLFSIDRETRELISRRGAGSVDLSRAAAGELEILQGLKEIRMLVPAGLPKGCARPEIDPAGIPLTTLVLEVAQDCNLRCRYCYAGGGSYGANARLIDPALAREAVRRLAKGAPEGEAVTLIIFGGEPLLNLAAVRAALEEVEAQREAGRRVNVSLTTNGTLLGPEALALIKRHRVSVSVSIDGPEELHDANRCNAAGEGSYREIVSRLAPLLEAGNVMVAARVTLLPGQWRRVEEVFDHLVGLGFHEVGIAPASPIRPEFLAGPSDEDDLLKGFASLAARFARSAAAGKLLPFTNLIDLLARLHLGQTKAIACGAGYGYLALDAGGDFYLCHRLTGEDGFRVGSLAGGVEAQQLRQALEKVGAGKDELCEGCWARTLCRGGCHYENHLREKQLGLPQGGSCRFVKSWLQLGIETYAQLRRDGGAPFFGMLEKRTFQR